MLHRSVSKPNAGKLEVKGIQPKSWQFVGALNDPIDSRL